MNAAPTPALTAAPWVMLLSVWPGDDACAPAGWHARVVLPDARTCEFDSPFELAQFLSRAGRMPPDAGSGSGGLR